jgi:hypothetical protein
MTSIFLLPCSAELNAIERIASISRSAFSRTARGRPYDDILDAA